jgi:hypothetical protein
MFRSVRRFSLLLLASLIASNTFGDSVTLIPSGDTTIDEAAPDNNFGGSADFSSGTNGFLTRSRGLVRFNLTGQIPSNVSIQSVTLTLIVVHVPASSPADSTFDLHRLLVDWGEGTGSSSGTPAVTGDATWNHRFHPSTSWSAAGAAAPGDFSSTVSASAFVQGLGSYTFGSTSNMVSDVRQWLANPATNFGWILITESEATSRTMRRFGSRESTSPATLVVQYVIPVTPTIKSIQRVNGTIQFTFAALAGQPYTAEYRDSLTAGMWSTLTNISPQSSNTDVVVTDPAQNFQRFYRVTTTF